MSYSEIKIIISINKIKKRAQIDLWVKSQNGKEGHTHSSPEWESKPGCRASESFSRHHPLRRTSRCGSLLDAAVLCAPLSPGHSGLCALTARTLNSPTPEITHPQNTDECWSGFPSTESFKVNVATPAVRCSALRCVAPPPLLPPSRPACPAGLVRGLWGETPAQQQDTNVARWCFDGAKRARDVLFARGFCLWSPRTRLSMTLVWTLRSPHTLILKQMYGFSTSRRQTE